MKLLYTTPFALLAGIGIGAVAVQTLHAQSTPPVYYISEVEITNVDGYVKEYAPKVLATIKASGGKVLAAGQKVTALEGDPPKTRVVVQEWGSLDKIKAWRESADYKEARKIGEKYAKFRAFTVEGVPQ